MGGRIWVDSVPHQGSQFHFTAEFGVGPTQAEMRPAVLVEAHEASPATTPSLRILLAEDHYINQVVAVRILEKWGHSVAVARTGREALRAVRSEPFDLVLMDVHMPDMDGLEVTVAIREGEKTTGKHLPIVAMTASAMQGDREKCLAAGMDDYVSKPIVPKILSDCLRAIPQNAGFEDVVL